VIIYQQGRQFELDVEATKVLRDRMSSEQR
jgi:hypothetical protein